MYNIKKITTSNVMLPMMMMMVMIFDTLCLKIQIQAGQLGRRGRPKVCIDPTPPLRGLPTPSLQAPGNQK